MCSQKITKLLNNTGGLCWIKGTAHKAMFVQIPASGPVFTKGLYQPSFTLYWENTQDTSFDLELDIKGKELYNFTASQEVCQTAEKL